MYICIYYVYISHSIHIYIYIYNPPYGPRGLTGFFRVRCHFLREQTGEHGFPRKPAGSSFRSYRSLRKSPETSRSSREKVIYLGVLYFGSLLARGCERAQHKGWEDRCRQAIRHWGPEGIEATWSLPVPS